MIMKPLERLILKLSSPQSKTEKHSDDKPKRISLKERIKKAQQTAKQNSKQNTPIKSRQSTPVKSSLAKVADRKCSPKIKKQ